MRFQADDIPKAIMDLYDTSVIASELIHAAILACWLNEFFILPIRLRAWMYLLEAYGRCGSESLQQVYSVSTGCSEALRVLVANNEPEEHFQAYLKALQDALPSEHLASFVISEAIDSLHQRVNH